ncbi:hypothetical protein A2U01_0074805, partial [Trifolium medium]|nr:hypothetical protein [Trifolium medium]
CSEASFEHKVKGIEKSTSTTDANDNQPIHPVEAEGQYSH